MLSTGVCVCVCVFFCVCMCVNQTYESVFVQIVSARCAALQRCRTKGPVETDQRPEREQLRSLLALFQAL